jgi:hypothetical protein
MNDERCTSGLCERPRGHDAPCTRRPLPAQVDIFGAEHVLAPEPAAPRATSTHEQPRLFEPQYEGQLDMSGDNYPEERNTDG